MQEIMEESVSEGSENTAAKIDSSSQQNEVETQDDTDADAFAILGLLFIIACTVVYYLSY